MMTTPNFKIKTVIISCLSLFFIHIVSFSQNFNDALLKYGNGGTGKLTTNSIVSRSIGLAYLNNNRFPDIFIQTNKNYIYQYPYIEHNNGIPVFGNEIAYNLPSVLTDENVALSIWQENSGELFLLGYNNQNIYLYAMNTSTNGFNFINTSKLPQNKNEILTLQFWREESRLCIVAAISSSKHIRPAEDHLSNDFYAYDGAGIYRGSLNKVGLYYFEYPQNLEGECQSYKLFTPSESEVYLNFISTSWFKNAKGENQSLVTGSWYGAISYYEYDKAANILLKRKYIYDVAGNPIRHSSQEVSPLTYPNEAGNFQDIIASGLGGLYYYRLTGNPDNDVLTYEIPTPLLQKNASVSTGAYATPTVYDWDGDGLLDIISGNAQGYIEFFKNIGTNENPEFAHGQNLKTGRSTIHVQPGYAESNYGPEYARNGFTGANVIDWNSDGLPDILINDGRGRHMVYLGVPESNNTKLRKAYPLYLKGLELRGTWRCRPGVGMMDGKMAYVTLDDDDELHLYWYMDAYNVTDGGKLYLRNLKKISGNAFKSLGTGRLKIELTDWDGDGKVDLILGAAFNASIPDATTGIPLNRKDGIKSSSVIFLKNVNTNMSPMYELPVEITYNGQYINLGLEECSPCSTTMGFSLNSLPNLLVGSSNGKFYLLSRNNLFYK